MTQEHTEQDYYETAQTEHTARVAAWLAANPTPTKPAQTPAWPFARALR